MLEVVVFKEVTQKHRKQGEKMGKIDLLQAILKDSNYNLSLFTGKEIDDLIK